MDQRLDDELRFVLELDRLKSVLRRTYLLDRSRHENSAEHSWHLAVMATVLAEHATEPMDLARVTAMLLVHDIVEIDAGDTFIYDDAGNADKAERERAAAERIYGLLPDDLAGRLRGLWEEFEQAETPEARFARSLDRLQPLLHNLETGGVAWAEHGVTAGQVKAVNRRIAEGAPALWAAVEPRIDALVAAGKLRP